MRFLKLAGRWVLEILKSTAVIWMTGIYLWSVDFSPIPAWAKEWALSPLVFWVMGYLTARCFPTVEFEKIAYQTVIAMALSSYREEMFEHPSAALMVLFFSKLVLYMSCFVWGYKSFKEIPTPAKSAAAAQKSMTALEGSAKNSLYCSAPTPRDSLWHHLIMTLFVLPIVAAILLTVVTPPALWIIGAKPFTIGAFLLYLLWTVISLFLSCLFLWLPLDSLFDTIRFTRSTTATVGVVVDKWMHQGKKDKEQRWILVFFPLAKNQSDNPEKNPLKMFRSMAEVLAIAESREQIYKGFEQIVDGQVRTAVDAASYEELQIGATLNLTYLPANPKQIWVTRFSRFRLTNLMGLLGVIAWIAFLANALVARAGVFLASQ